MLILTELDGLNVNHRSLAWLISELDSHSGVIDEPTVRPLLAQANLDRAEVAPYIEQRADTYARRCVVRRENYEVLVLTRCPSQGSVAHDHSGSLCGLKVVQGCLIEQLFEEGPDRTHAPCGKIGSRGRRSDCGYGRLRGRQRYILLSKRFSNANGESLLGG